MTDSDERGMTSHPFGSGSDGRYLSGLSDERIQLAKEAHARFCLVTGIEGNWDTLVGREKFAWWVSIGIHVDTAKTASSIASNLAKSSTQIRDNLAASLDVDPEDFSVNELLTAVHKLYWETDDAMKAYLDGILADRAKEEETWGITDDQEDDWELGRGKNIGL